METTNLDKVLIALLPLIPFIVYGIAWGLDKIIDYKLWKK